MKQLILLLLMAYCTIAMFAIEVGGHITQNTTWTPADNPYIVTSFLYIDAGVTLTIEPGTEIRVYGAHKNFNEYFDWDNNTEPLAKMIVVYGKIVAIGTEQSPITFDVHSDNTFYYRWGGIYMDESSSMSSFKYCKFNRTYMCYVDYYTRSFAALHFNNGFMYLRDCIFYNNYLGLRSENLMEDFVVFRCKFYSENDTYPEGPPAYVSIGVNEQNNPEAYYYCTMARCYFSGNPSKSMGGYHTNVLYLNSIFDDTDADNTSEYEIREPWSDFGIYSAYGNLLLLNGYGSLGCTSQRSTDYAYARRNKIIKLTPTDPIRLGGDGLGDIHISDNYLHGSVKINSYPAHAPNTYIYNNIIETSYQMAFEVRSNTQYQDGEMRIFNNLIRSINPDSLYWTQAFYVFDSHPLVFNNTITGFGNYTYSLNTIPGESVFYNNVYFDMDSAPSNGSDAEHPINYGSNCFNLPFGYTDYIIDAGGNIVADPMFADSLGGDYSLIQGSPCIDAGAYLPDLPAFDIRYHKRISSGYSGGPRAVDMGAYEYNSVYIGGISGYVSDSVSGLPVDCAKIEIMGKLPEFSDTLGCFPYPCGAGTYTVKVSRWDYEDLIIPNVVVVEGEDTILNIPLQRSDVATEDQSTPPVSNSLSLSNYPNPFNPNTTFSFILPQTGDTKLSIYNIKGQKVKTLTSAKLVQGHHSLVWNSCDDRGKPLASGLYFAKLEQGTQVKVHKLMLLK